MNKKYRVWLVNTYPIDIEAKDVKIVYLNDKPREIRFVGDKDYILAAFYCENVCGWAEIVCLAN